LDGWFSWQALSCWAHGFFDQELGISSLPGQLGVRMVGMVALPIGAYLIFVSSIALMHFGEGAGAFWLTKRPVVRTIYGLMRNPMSLGLYLMSAGIGLLAGSTHFTLGTLFGVIPVHVFYLKCFEEYELELRLAQSCVEYKQRVPFLLPKLMLRKR
jgi:protein-S-isoprenylcysteine O-methyltransferase Ste14